MDKAAWRRELRARRAGLTEEQRVKAEEKMTARFQSLPPRERGGVVLLYAAVPPEAPTKRLIETLWDGGVTVCLPRLHRSRPGIIDPVVVRGWDELVPGPYFDIPQPPADGPVLAPEQLDVIVLPGVGFDRRGRRVGQAGGYYDRLLARTPDRVVRIGWAFEVQFVDELPEEPHDEGVDLLVTEDALRRFSRR